MVGAVNPIVVPGATMGDPTALRDARSKEAYKDFEAMFLHMLMQEMRKSVPEGGLFEKNQASEFYEDMLDTVFAESMAESGQFGIARQIEAQIRAQEAGFSASDFPEAEALEMPDNNEVK